MDRPLDEGPKPLLAVEPERSRGSVLLGGGLLWHHLWTAVLAANLIMPMMLARTMVSETGLIGMGLAVGMLWLIGDLAGARSRWTRRLLLTGGIALAASQLFPIIQIIAGILGVGVTGLIFDVRNTQNIGIGRPLNGLEAWLATILTGGLLLLASLVPGWILLRVHTPRSGRTSIGS